MLLGNMPIRKKLMTVLLLTSGVVLAMSCASFTAYEVITLRKGMIEGYGTRAQIIAANSTAALAFQNSADAASVLEALQTDKRIIEACLYDEKGRLFARYPSNVSAEAFPPGPGSSGYRKDYLEIFTPVIQGDRALGTVYLRSDLTALTDRYQAYAWLSVAIVVGSLLLGYLLARVLQQQISGPILALARTAGTVTREGNFSIRAPKVGEDELGAFTDTFNRMLDEIQRKDRSLMAS